MVNKKKHRALTKEELRTAALVCFRSAEELLADAEFLCVGGRFARAVFLSCIGIEEVGKAAVAVELCEINFAFDSEEQVKSFWSFWRDHKAKAARGDGYYAVNVEILEKLAPDLIPEGFSSWREFEESKDEVYGSRSQALLTIKEAALYVDFVDREGDVSGFRLPSTIFRAKHAEQFLGILLERLEAIRGRIKSLGWLQVPPYISEIEPYIMER